jgi:hypothetical protein
MVAITCASHSRAYCFKLPRLMLAPVGGSGSGWVTGMSYSGNGCGTNVGSTSGRSAGGTGMAAVNGLMVTGGGAPTLLGVPIDGAGGAKKVCSVGAVPNTTGSDSGGVPPISGVPGSWISTVISPVLGVISPVLESVRVSGPGIRYPGLFSPGGE